MSENGIVFYIAISIHAPAKGATTSIKFFRFLRYNFNPRSREGSDRLAYAVTHTPNYFNPRSREGSDNVQSLNVSLLSRFQSTLPRRERPYTFLYSDMIISFQSTLPRRERLRDTEMAEPVTQFQSTLPRRERQIMWRMDLTNFFNFNPRSREGSDQRDLRK